MEKKEFKTKSQYMQEQFHEFLENKLKQDGYSSTESDLFYKFEEYINARLAALETTASMIANGIAIEKDTGIAQFRSVPTNERFTVRLSNMDETLVSRVEFIDYIRTKSMEAVNSGIPTLSYEYDYLFKQAPSLNRVLKSSGEYPVELIAMMLQKNTNYSNTDLICLFATGDNDIFTYRFRKNNKYDMFTPNYNSTFEVKDRGNICQYFSLKVAPSRTSGLLRVIDMEKMTITNPQNTSSVPSPTEEMVRNF